MQTSLIFTICHFVKFHVPCDLENEVKVTKTKSHLTPLPKMKLCKFGQIHQLVLQIECRQGSFLPTKLSEDLENRVQSKKHLIKYFANYTINQVRPKSINCFKRQGEAFRGSKFDILRACVTLKIRSRSPKPNHLFYFSSPNNVSTPK